MGRIEGRHPILEGFAGTPLIPGAEYRVPLAPVEGVALTVVPGYVAYPPELSYPEPAKTTEPAMVARERGRSRTVFFPATSIARRGAQAIPTCRGCCRTRSAGWPARRHRRWSKGTASSSCSRGKPRRATPSTS